MLETAPVFVNTSQKNELELRFDPRNQPRGILPIFPLSFYYFSAPPSLALRCARWFIVSPFVLEVGFVLSARFSYLISLERDALGPTAHHVGGTFTFLFHFVSKP